MAAFSNYVEDALINHLLRGVALSSLSTTYISLHTGDPTDANVATELVAPAALNYARVTLAASAWSAPSNGVTSNTVDITFATAGSNWAPSGTPLTHFGLYDALSGGNLIFHSPLAASKVVNTGDVVRFTTGNLSIQLQ